ncbi:MAG: hypothetical protein KJ955_04305, partial [Nanoarchaeota archaeon]|nr:hypothetical protein [Nanoarchaeota archaeon]
MANIAWFRELHNTDVNIAGGKGASLGEMFNAGMPIPPGFVVTAEAFKNFITKTKIDEKMYKVLAGLDVENNAKLQEAAKKVQAIILQTAMPKDIKESVIEAYDYLCFGDAAKAGGKALSLMKTGRDALFVAVRSSATAEDLPSISEDEHILITANGNPIYAPMKEIYEKLGDGSHTRIEIPAMKDNEIRWTDVGGIYRHKASSDTLYRIKTETGREITVSPNHSLIVLDRNNLMPKISSIHNLEKEDMVPAISALPMINSGIRFIDVLDYVHGKDVAEQDGRIKIKNNSTNWKIQNGLKKRIQITEDFAYFLGLYTAEGCTYKSNNIIITNSNKEAIERIKRAFKELGIGHSPKLNKHSIRIYCKALVRLLHELTGKPTDKKGKGRSCGIKRAPNFIFGCDKQIIASFLAGCFDGDGYVGKDCITFDSTSKMLSGGVIKLLEMLGLKFYFRARKNKAYTVYIPPYEAKKFKDSISLENKVKSEKLNALITSYEKRKKFSRFKESFHITDSLANKIRQKFEAELPKKQINVAICPCCAQRLEPTSYYKHKRRYRCKNCRKTYYKADINYEARDIIVNYDVKGRFTKQSIPWNKALPGGTHSIQKITRFLCSRGLNDLAKFWNTNVKWDKIEKITPLTYDGWVYDFTVPDVENFAAGVGGIITHNTASFAGQQATFLNIKGQQALVEAVQQCWASLYTARAIYYRIKNNFEHSKVFIAVVVQKMVESDTAGVMFSVNPVNNNEDEIMIEASYGLGEAVVSGAISPDQYVVSKNSETIKESTISNKNWMYTLDKKTNKNVRLTIPNEKARAKALSDYEIISLAKLAKQIEQHYGKPQDLEYAIEGKNIYIVQSRPITTLKKTPAEPKNVEEEQAIDTVKAKVILTGISASPGVGIGPVKIVRTGEELDKIQKGDVLVAEMTNPDYVSAMEKSVAIVTDQGGSTCFDGNTLLLTNKGFMQISQVCENYEGIMVPSLNRNTLKIEWKPVIASMKRKAKAIEIAVSQTGRMKGNHLRLTHDHKMVTLENRKIADRAIKDMLDASEMPLIAQKIPGLNKANEYELKKAYLLGALMTDGSIWRSRTKGKVTFIQKPTAEKEDFINTVTACMKEIYGKDVGIYAKKISTGIISGKPVIGSANAYCWSSKQVAMQIEQEEQLLVQEILYGDKELAMHFLAGAIDGDGSFNHKEGRINIYVGNSMLMESIIVSCLRIGIVPQVSVNRNIYNVQIVERVNDLLSCTKRVKGVSTRNRFGTRFFAAKQILSDVREGVNYKGRTKPYIDNNLLLDSEKIKKDLLPLCNEAVRNDMQHLLDSDTRMIRASFERELDEIDVYNITVAENHNYVVFTDRYTPIIVNNCHAAIVGREMGIPVIVGTEVATKELHENQLITVDASHGKVYEGKVEIKREVKPAQLVSAGEPLETVTAIKVIVDLPEFAKKAALTNADGIGLVRCEMMMAKHEHPGWLVKNNKKEILLNALVEGISGIAKEFKGKPVWYRTSDFRSDEYRNLKGGDEEPKEDNPMLGWHGIRRGLDQKELLKTEFEAIKKVHELGFHTVGVMLPMVTHVEQVVESKEIM